MSAISKLKATFNDYKTSRFNLVCKDLLSTMSQNLQDNSSDTFPFQWSCWPLIPSHRTQDVNWTYTRSSKDTQDVFWASDVRLTYLPYLGELLPRLILNIKIVVSEITVICKFNILTKLERNMRLLINESWLYIVMTRFFNHE